jgi:hypothetical protein
VYTELLLLSLGVGLAVVDLGSNPSGASLPEVFATLSLVMAMVVAVAATVVAVTFGLLEGYRSFRGRAR